MSWPKGRPRPKKADSKKEEKIIGSEFSQIWIDECVEPIERAPNTPPADWTKGQLLNVRNYGHAYIITAYPEEFQQDKPERAIQFTNPGECQDFVSDWYARESYNPLAR